MRDLLCVVFEGASEGVRAFVRVRVLCEARVCDASVGLGCGVRREASRECDECSKVVVCCASEFERS